MDKIEPGGVSFPPTRPTIDLRTRNAELRDYFAGRALAKVGSWPEGLILNDVERKKEQFQEYAAKAAQAAYLIADAMIAERAKWL